MLKLCFPKLILLVLPLIESCFLLGVMVSIFCSLEEEIKGDPKKVSRKREEKMQKRKKKMILQIDEYLVLAVP